MKRNTHLSRNAEAGFFVKRAKVKAEYAETALLKAAEYIRDGAPLPPALAEYLADAIESAMNIPEQHDPNYTPEKGKGRALCVALGLEANNRRPSTYHDPDLIRQKVQFLMLSGKEKAWRLGYSDTDIQQLKGAGNDVQWLTTDKGMSQNEAVKKAADGFGVSISTIKRIINDDDV